MPAAHAGADELADRLDSHRWRIDGLLATQEAYVVQLGMIGLGRMGANMVRRLLRRGHECVVHDVRPQAVASLVQAGATGAASLHELVSRLVRPRALWMMLPATAVDAALADLSPLLEADDVIVEGGNSRFQDDVRRGATLGTRGIHYVDVGTSGGVAGLERGYCLMIGGDAGPIQRLRPIFSALAPGAAAAVRSPNRHGVLSAAEEGFLHCGPHGAGHYAKMVHNGIEYGLMAAYAEGLNLLRAANGNRTQDVGATAGSVDNEAPHYEFDVADLAEVWRRGSVIGSWLLDLAASSLVDHPHLEPFSSQVPDSGEGRWAVQAALDRGVPVPVLSAALSARFASRGNAAFANRVLSAMRHGFGGHVGNPVPEQD
jgi:6-phosphogluconate dehydrogenase